MISWSVSIQYLRVTENYWGVNLLTYLLTYLQTDSHATTAIAALTH